MLEAAERMVGKMEGPREVGRSINFWRERIGGGSRDEEVGNWGKTESGNWELRSLEEVEEVRTGRREMPCGELERKRDARGR